MADLKPCPFCGATATVESDFGKAYWVQCDNTDCNATGATMEPTPQAAEEWWNRRPDGVKEDGNG